VKLGPKFPEIRVRRRDFKSHGRQYVRRYRLVLVLIKYHVIILPGGKFRITEDLAISVDF